MEISSRFIRSHSTPSHIKDRDEFMVRWLIGWPERVAQHLPWVAPLFARAPLELLERGSKCRRNTPATINLRFSPKWQQRLGQSRNCGLSSAELRGLTSN